MAAPRRRLSSFGIFAEGATATSPRDYREAFESLWRELCGHVCQPLPMVHVYGFDKGQIVLLAKPESIRLSQEPLDVFIERMHRQDGFQNAIIAFDRIPANQVLPHSCLRTEVNFILKRFDVRKKLPPAIQHEVPRLLARYENFPKQPRTPGRPPRGSLDFIYMDPMFEGLLVHDETTVRKALGLSRFPKDWPSFDPYAQNPAQDILPKAVCLAAPAVCGKVRGSMKTNKHGWALWIVKNAPPGARLFTHPIATRLKTLLA